MIKKTSYFLVCALLPILCFEVSADNKSYHLKGEISGYFVTQDKCYLAIKDDSNKYYSNQWHIGEGKLICDFVKMAYLLNMPVFANVSVDPDPNDANNVQSIYSTRGKITWPPYHEKDHENKSKGKN